MRARLLLNGFARPPWPALFAVAGAGLLLAAVQGGRSGEAALPAFCGAGWVPLLRAPGASDPFALLFRINPPARLMAEWALMLVAMMPLLLAGPLAHVARSSLPRRRVRALAGFVLGYGAAWLAAGPVLIGLALLLQLAFGAAALPAALLLAAAWSAAPWQRAALNRGCRLRRIGVFGWAADRDCLAFGAVHGGWCIASCWAWMLVPLAAGAWHLPFMVLAGAVMLGQRLARRSTPCWRLPALLAGLNRPRRARVRG